MITKDDLYKIEFEEKISHEQGYKLRQLVDEGYDVTEGIQKYVEGISPVNDLCRKIKGQNNK